MLGQPRRPESGASCSATDGSDSAPLVLANAIGGTAAIKAAVVGGSTLPNGVRPAPVNGISLQSITDVKATIEAMAGATPAPNTADRDGTAKGVAAAQGMSQGTMAKSSGSLASVAQELSAAVATLQKPVQPFNAQEFNTAYGLNGTAVNNFKAKMAAAELMVRTGTNFVFATDGGWDTHGDSSGTTVRNQMTQRIAPGLGTFLQRTVGSMTDRNVIVAIFGDFHRSLPGSDHPSNLAALVTRMPMRARRRGPTEPATEATGRHPPKAQRLRATPAPLPIPPTTQRRVPAQSHRRPEARSRATPRPRASPRACPRPPSRPWPSRVAFGGAHAGIADRALSSRERGDRSHSPRAFSIPQQQIRSWAERRGSIVHRPTR